MFPVYNALDGIQINHFATAGTYVDPTNYSTAGVGTNNITTEPSTYDGLDFCMGSNLLLEGTEETSTLAATVSAYSDGYKATSSLELATFLAGERGAWKGYCMVNYQT